MPNCSIFHDGVPFLVPLLSMYQHCLTRHNSNVGTTARLRNAEGRCWCPCSSTAGALLSIFCSSRWTRCVFADERPIKFNTEDRFSGHKPGLCLAASSSRYTSISKEMSAQCRCELKTNKSRSGFSSLQIFVPGVRQLRKRCRHPNLPLCALGHGVCQHDS